jgi:hypothetical protein
MKDYKVFFEIGGKKLKTTVTAKDEYDARAKVRAMINFVKIEEVDVPDFTDTLADFLGFKR